MKFWGAEVKPGKPLMVTPDEHNLIHISQASLDSKVKMGETVVLSVNVDGTKLVIGTLSQDKFPQISFDLVFEKTFELSHNCTKGSVHFIGYKSPNIDEGDDYISGSDEEEEVPAAVPAPVAANGNAGAAASTVVKADKKPKAKPEEVKPESDDEDDSDDEFDDDDFADEFGEKAKLSLEKPEEKKKAGHTATPYLVMKREPTPPPYLVDKKARAEEEYLTSPSSAVASDPGKTKRMAVLCSDTDNQAEMISFGTADDMISFKTTQFHSYDVKPPGKNEYLVGDDFVLGGQQDIDSD